MEGLLSTGPTLSSLLTKSYSSTNIFESRDLQRRGYCEGMKLALKGSVITEIASLADI